MYVPKHFALEDVAEIHALMRAYPFAALLTHGREGLCATHIPTVLKTGESSKGLVQCHLSRANPHWQMIGAAGVEALLIFNGPQAYVTPAWYPSKADHGRVVPTWNYAVVHAHGHARLVEDRDWLMRHVSELSDLQEADRDEPWATSDAPARYMAGQVRGIVGIEFAIERLDAKAKMSQNRGEDDRAGVARGLGARGRDGDDVVADWVRRGLDQS